MCAVAMSEAGAVLGGEVRYVRLDIDIASTSSIRVTVRSVVIAWQWGKGEVV